MSHEIEKAVFSQAEGAGWTGLGQAIPVELGKDTNAIAELCGATYTVEKRDLYYRTPNGEYIMAPDDQVLVRADTNALLTTVSMHRYHTDYRQPRDIFNAFDEQLRHHGLEISHGAVLRGGAQVAVSALLPSDLDIVVGKADRIRSYLTLSTGYDGAHGTPATVGGIRVVCANTLAYSLTDATSKGTGKKYTASQKLNKFSLADLLAEVKVMVAKEQEVYGAMMEARMSNEEVATYFTECLELHIERMDKNRGVSTKTKNILTALAAAYNTAPGAAVAHGTAWGALNAVTYYATHVKTCRDSFGAGADAARAASNLDGDAAKLKLRALQLAANLAVAA
jgi:phage/plasmid-like protein (TIGR03299 family)